MNLRLGISSGALYPNTATENAVDFAAVNGLQDIEFLLQTPSEYEPSFASILRERCAELGVRVQALHTFHPLHPITTPYQRRTDEACALFRNAIDAAHVL